MSNRVLLHVPVYPAHDSSCNTLNYFKREIVFTFVNPGGQNKTPSFHHMKKTDRELLLKSLKFFGYTMLMMFLAPVVIYQAFKNQTHPWYWPVLITGVLIAIGAIALGFYSIRLIMRAFFGKKR